CISTTNDSCAEAPGYRSSCLRQDDLGGYVAIGINAHNASLVDSYRAARVIGSNGCAVHQLHKGTGDLTGLPGHRAGRRHGQLNEVTISPLDYLYGRLM